jgi:hypothetical protein
MKTLIEQIRELLEKEEKEMDVKKYGEHTSS